MADKLSATVTVANLVDKYIQVRSVVKSYSFIRENAYKVLYPWNKDDQEGPAVWYRGQMNPRVGSFLQYVYFLCSPTILYRDHYPRYNERLQKLQRYVSILVFTV